MASRQQKYRAFIENGNLKLPVDIIIERRNNTRFGITTAKKITLRLPFGVTQAIIHEELNKLQVWIQEVFSKKPALRDGFETTEWKSGDVLTVGSRRYALVVAVEARATHTGKLDKGVIYLQLSQQSTPANRLKAAKTLLSRVVAGDFYPEIKNKVLDWNERTFQRPIKSINLKYNHSNWGSCSVGNNINLSTRLLFAPAAVQDYVILHELAHLVEHNHSDRFWALVERYMPDYMEKERWLKANRGKCDFLVARE